MGAKPLACLPMLSDEMDVAARVAEAGAGIVLNKRRLMDAAEALDDKAADMPSFALTLATCVLPGLQFLSPRSALWNLWPLSQLRPRSKGAHPSAEPSGVREVRAAIFRLLRDGQKAPTHGTQDEPSSGGDASGGDASGGGSGGSLAAVGTYRAAAAALGHTLLAAGGATAAARAVEELLEVGAAHLFLDTQTATPAWRAAVLRAGVPPLTGGWGPRAREWAAFSPPPFSHLDETCWREVALLLTAVLAVAVVSVHFLFLAAWGLWQWLVETGYLASQPPPPKPNHTHPVDGEVPTPSEVVSPQDGGLPGEWYGLDDPHEHAASPAHAPASSPPGGGDLGLQSPGDGVYGPVGELPTLEMGELQAPGAASPPGLAAVHPARPNPPQ